MALQNAKSCMLRRAAKDIKPNMLVNLGIGLPAQVLNYIPKDAPLFLHSENGVTGAGPRVDSKNANPNLVDAGGDYISIMAGACYFDSATSFALVRSGRLDLTLLGTFQVSEKGDLANWIIPNKFTPGSGGAIELAQKAKKVGVISMHRDKNGNSKILKNCTLPVTALACVDRIYTDMAVMDVKNDGLHLIEISSNTTIDEVVKATEASLIIDKNKIKTF